MKKNGLSKIILILIFVAGILTWLIPASYYSGTEVVDLGMNRVGFFDFFNFIFSSFMLKYFLQIVLFILSVGGLYGVLNKTNAYRSILEKITKSLKGKESIFLVVSAFLLSALNATFGFDLILFIFVPALISILLLMGYSKLTTYLATFGAIMVGVIGSIISPVNLQINSIVGTTLADNLAVRIILFVLSFALLMVFTLINIKKEKKSKSKDEVTDLFLPEKSTKDKGKIKTWPIYALYGALFVLMVLSCIKWVDTFKVNIFADALTKINAFEIKDITIVRYLLGEAVAFGEWSFNELTIVIIVFTLIIGGIYKVKTLEEFTEGVKKMIKPALLVLFAYVVLYLAGNVLFYNKIIEYVIGLTKHLSVATSAVLVAIGSVFHVDFGYTASYVLPTFTGVYTKIAELKTLAFLGQSIYGLTMFVAPTSIMLILGLEYLNIPYKKWLQYIWKFAVALLIVIILISLIIRYL